jgi:hypothetical protein
LKTTNKILKQIIFILFFSATTVAGYSQPHYDAWFRTTASYNISQKLRFDAEMHYRTQNDSGSINPFDKNLLFAFRPVFYYRLNKKLLFSTAPISYFSSNRIIQTPSDALLPPNKELRTTILLEYQQPITKSFSAFLRTGYEIRMLKKPANDITRLRTRLALRHTFNEKAFISLANEYMNNLSGVPSANKFELNRTILTASFTLNPTFRFETGFMHTHRLLRSNQKKLNEEAVFLFLIYSLNAKKTQAIVK